MAFAILGDTPAAAPAAAMSDQLLMPRGTEADERADNAFREHYALLYFIAASRFRLPEPEAENVVQDVFVNFLRHRHHIANERSWLVAAACNASRDYWRSPHRREQPAVPERSASPVEQIAASLDVKALMRALPGKCRELLHRRYCDGCSPDELAKQYATTTGYAKIMLHRCLTAARALLVVSRRAV
jgi:RNA polymerase sigma factor (sigma-70 family)